MNAELGSLNIVIAEDDPVSALKIKRMLERLGHAATVFGDGAAALAGLESVEANVVVTDWSMPNMDGVDLCRALRRRAEASYLYVIMLTSRDGRDDRLACIEAGADDFLSKPVDGDELRSRLNVAGRILLMQRRLSDNSRRLAELMKSLEEKNRRLDELAVRDQLTGLGNRRMFDQAIGAASAFACRYDRPMSLILIDVDHFKKLNDRFGHQVGDEALRQVGALIQRFVRSTDVACRYGGEEFAVILPSTTAGEASVVAERIRSALADERYSFGPITCSLGVAEYRDGERATETLIERADRALYQAKQDGRNRFVVDDPLILT